MAKIQTVCYVTLLGELRLSCDKRLPYHCDILYVSHAWRWALLPSVFWFPQLFESWGLAVPLCSEPCGELEHTELRRKNLFKLLSILKFLRWRTAHVVWNTVPNFQMAFPAYTSVLFKAAWYPFCVLCRGKHFCTQANVNESQRIFWK